MQSRDFMKTVFCVAALIALGGSPVVADTKSSASVTRSGGFEALDRATETRPAPKTVKIISMDEGELI